MKEGNKNNKNWISRMVLLALFSTIALTIFVLESALPPLAPIPGIKLGLANVVTLILLLLFNERDALMVLLVRILIGSIAAGQMMSFMYSLCGGLLCFFVMSLINRILAKRYIFITSIFGAIAHNIGQIIIAIIITGSLAILMYVPLLMISGVITGTFTGFCAYFAAPKLEGIFRKYLN